MNLNKKIKTKKNNFYQDLDHQKYNTSNPSCIGMIGIFLSLLIVIFIIFLFIYINK